MFNRKLRKELEDTQQRLELLESNLFAERKSHDNTFVLLLQEQELRKTVEEANERMREIHDMRVGEAIKPWAK